MLLGTQIGGYTLFPTYLTLVVLAAALLQNSKYFGSMFDRWRNKFSMF